MTETGGGTTGGGTVTATGPGTAGQKPGWSWKPWLETPAEMPSKDERTLGLATNLVAIFGLLGLIGVLVIWLMKKETSRFINAVGKETLNFQLSVLIYFVGVSFAAVPLMWLCGLGLLIWAALGVGALILLILAAIKSNEGLIYRFPANLRLIK